MSDKPLLLFDVDGPLIPWDMSAKVAKKQGFRTHKGFRQEYGRVLKLSRTQALMILSFVNHYDFEMVWATYWNDQAPPWIGAYLGFPPDMHVIYHEPNEYEATWKFRDVAEYAQGRPLAWLDDEFLLHAQLRKGFERTRSEPTLLVDVSAKTGITALNLSEIARWREAL